MDPTIYYRQLPSPLGKLLLTSDGAALTGLFMTRLAEESAPGAGGPLDAGRRTLPRRRASS